MRFTIRRVAELIDFADDLLKDVIDDNVEGFYTSEVENLKDYLRYFTETVDKLKGAVGDE